MVSRFRNCFFFFQMMSIESDHSFFSNIKRKWSSVSLFHFHMHTVCDKVVFFVVSSIDFIFIFIQLIFNWFALKGLPHCHHDPNCPLSLSNNNFHLGIAQSQSAIPFIWLFKWKCVVTTFTSLGKFIHRLWAHLHWQTVNLHWFH